MSLLQSFLRENTTLDVCARDGWFYAFKKGQSGPGCDSEASGAASNAPIAFRADMDALPIPETICLPYGSKNPGISHKCGHDGHSAALCGLALELSGMETARDVYLIFQPGEEIGAGALRCRDLIQEKGIAEVYAFHNLGGYPEGALVYRRGLTQPASEGLKIRLTGKASHASAPEKGNNPAGVLAGIVQFAMGIAAKFQTSKQELDSTRSCNEFSAVGQEKPLHLSAIGQEKPLHLPMRLCTVTGIRLGEGDFGISPGEGEICMTLRAEVESEMKAMEEAVLTYSESAASDAGLGIKWSIHDYFPETRNHDAPMDKVLEAARKNKMPAIPMEEIWRASEDFGYYLKICPGAMFYIGNGEQYPALHTAEYDFNDRILKKAVDLFAALI
ncbi:MAG: M20/M25/M40 family metallo-hydrolase [Eubacteriales bacterium]|nr:M20/M25/M40 family metallo-hydrolase [Eubacteriales bacterium]